MANADAASALGLRPHAKPPEKAPPMDPPMATTVAINSKNPFVLIFWFLLKTS